MLRFKDELKLDEGQIRRLPKTDLHCHLDGSLRKSTLLELAQQQQIAVPSVDYFSSACTSLEDYLDKFSVSCSVLQTVDALTRVAYELVEDAFADGIWHLEMRFSPLLFSEHGLSMREQIEAVYAGIQAAQQRGEISVGIILCGLRHRTSAENLTVVRAALNSKDLGVVGFDLAGPEVGYAASVHATSFQLAHEGCLSLTVHAGEADGPASIRDALFNCGAHRIGHGNQLHRDCQLFNYVVDHQIPIEVCLSSNRDTGVVKNIANHPMKQYLDAGAVVTLNTDNRLISNTNLTMEYVLAQKELDLSALELIGITRNGFAAAFLPWRTKQNLLARFDAFVQ